MKAKSRSAKTLKPPARKPAVKKAAAKSAAVKSSRPLRSIKNDGRVKPAIAKAPAGAKTQAAKTQATPSKEPQFVMAPVDGKPSRLQIQTRE